MKCQIKNNLILQKFFIYHCPQEREGRVKIFFSAESLSVVEITTKCSKSLIILRLPLVMMSRALALRASEETQETSGEVALKQAQRS